jgi:hypothetical protein
MSVAFIIFDKYWRDMAFWLRSFSRFSKQNSRLMLVAIFMMVTTALIIWIDDRKETRIIDLGDQVLISRPTSLRATTKTNQMLWQQSFGQLVCTALRFENLTFVYDCSRLYALNATTGAIRWQMELLGSGAPKLVSVFRSRLAVFEYSISGALTSTQSSILDLQNGHEVYSSGEELILQTDKEFYMMNVFPSITNAPEPEFSRVLPDGRSRQFSFSISPRRGCGTFEDLSLSGTPPITTKNEITLYRADLCGEFSKTFKWP